MNSKTILTTTIILFAFTDVSTLFKKKITYQCPNYNSQLVNLFTIMCSNIANGTNNTLRDACTGCFQQASNINGRPSVASIVSCATMYLVNTNYSSCFNLPNNPPTTTTTTARPTRTTTTTTTRRPPTTPPTPATTTTPTTRPTPPQTTPPGIDPRLKRSINLNCDNGFCGYVSCIRSVNSNILIAGCFAEASVSNNATYPDQQVVLYKNITSCILAKSRCASLNPISGTSQNGRYNTQSVTKFGTTTTSYYYSLQIASNGELRIIGLPGTVALQQDFCSTQNTLQESTWTNFVC